jgi:hypothetical protein
MCPVRPVECPESARLARELEVDVPARDFVEERYAARQLRRPK